MPEGTSSPSPNMDGSLPSYDFPPLVTSPGGQVRVISKSWNKVFEPSNTSANLLKFSHFPSELDIIPFSGEKLSNRGEDLKLCLVGYSIGRRPYYEALLTAVKKTWNLEGSVQLLHLNDGFFLFRFSCAKDFDLVWTRGVWFILGKPFVLQKRHPKFIPKREDFATVPIWVKIHDLPLACWNSEGISRIASKIGVPVAADSLTEQKTRLTFARICVLVDCKATYPEVVQVSLDGEVVSLRVQYEWRPFPCQHCKSLMHYSSSCSKNPENEPNDLGKDISKEMHNNRGRSTSRRPRFRPNAIPDNVAKIPVSKISNHEPINPQNTHNSQDSPSLVIGHPLQYQPHSPPPSILKSRTEDIVSEPPNMDIPLIGDPFSLDIPNLNSPNDDASSSSTNLQSQSTYVGKVFVSPNKFDLLNDVGDVRDPASISTENLESDALSVEDVGKEKITKFCNNFTFSVSGRIWMKWNSSKLSFTPAVTTSQMISGMISVFNQSLFQLSVVHASNSTTERKTLWNDLTLATPVCNVPWAIIRDFNCCRFATEKLGGSPLSHSSLKDFNDCIFLNGLVDLHSVGCNFTWFNQRVDNLIHIKLDRVLVNNSWLKKYSESFCSIQNPSCSDHCPVILHSWSSNKAFHRYLFKYY
ncbi:uncharacterized protein LOC110099846 [Dendrobium catenatum]|uniref:uncharacterized protein LOC110099846 n=1 Tax=Dendrobium catenatum TaxID=906689 RepID=UPI0009F25D0B|nr:uncharacterized protein LOC110099846 [Dendrobium catenatum]